MPVTVFDDYTQESARLSRRELLARRDYNNAKLDFASLGMDHKDKIRDTNDKHVELYIKYRDAKINYEIAKRAAAQYRDAYAEVKETMVFRESISRNLIDDVLNDVVKHLTDNERETARGRRELIFPLTEDEVSSNDDSDNQEDVFEYTQSTIHLDDDDDEASEDSELQLRESETLQNVFKRVHHAERDNDDTADTIKLL